MASVYPRQQNTPMVKKVHHGKVRVTDPRHVLFGRKLPLIDIHKNGRGVECCTVRLEDGLERSIPIAETDLSATAPSVYPLPLDVPSIERLLTAFRRVLGHSRRRKGKQK